MQSILQSLEQQHEEEKRSALERQRLMYEHELEQLRRRLSPEKQHFRSMDRFSFHSPSAQQRLRQWAEERWVIKSGYQECSFKVLWCQSVLQDLNRIAHLFQLSEKTPAGCWGGPSKNINLNTIKPLILGKMRKEECLFCC